MDIELQNKLFKKYPVIFRDRNKLCRYTAMCWGIETGNGWAWLLDILCLAITEHIRDNKDVEPVVATQVKEKFGTLRFYYNGGDDYINGAVWFAEKLSEHICENCGTTENVKQNDTGWVITLCDKCRLEYLKRRANT